MSLSDTSGEYIAAVGKASPPLAVTSVAAAGWTLQDWVLICTILYTVLQMSVLVYNTFIKPRLNGGK